MKKRFSLCYKLMLIFRSLVAIASIVEGLLAVSKAVRVKPVHTAVGALKNIAQGESDFTVRLAEEVGKCKV
ncbi:MAG: hypothetical protein ACTTJ7_05630 [Treponema sp.]